MWQQRGQSTWLQLSCIPKLACPKEWNGLKTTGTIMSLGRHGCQPEANLDWHLADNNNVAIGYSIQSVKNRISRTELDSNANMPVMGRDALVVSDTGKVME
eukprot:6628280-Ditylum_brightwellii.AAC.1